MSNSKGRLIRTKKAKKIACNESRCARCYWMYINGVPSDKPDGTFALHGSHIFSVGAWPNLADVKENIICLCYYHHIEWAHKNPKRFTEWLEEAFPNRMELLRGMMRDYHKNKVSYEDGESI